MNIGEYIRNNAFRAIDAMRKRQILKYVDELQTFEADGCDYTKVQKKLNEFLIEAQISSAFYSSKKDNVDLSTYPVMTKGFLRNNMELIQSAKYVKKELIKVATSGSYGTPCFFYLSPEKKKRQLAEVIYYSMQIGYNVGDRHGYFRTALSKSNLKLWLQNETFICSKILGDDFLITNRLLLKRKKLKILIGFPSAIAILAQFCMDQGDEPKDFEIKGIVTFAENLTSKQRECISKAFGCSVHSRYGTEELGVLGYQYTNNSGFMLNTCNYIIEVLKLNEDKSVLPGETGRVVVTDLHSNAFPLIRYETGDLAVLGEEIEGRKGWARSFKALSGRMMQLLYATNGEKLYPLYFENIIEKLNIFVQFQLIQEAAKDFTLKLVPAISFSKDSFSEIALTNELKKWLGSDANIKLQLVVDIERLPSGKRPAIINRLIV